MDVTFKESVLYAGRIYKRGERATLTELEARQLSRFLTEPPAREENFVEEALPALEAGNVARRSGK